ncbi:molybdopterin cofactor-binding domain-containing protein, partial [Staphylococcus aureus]
MGIGRLAGETCVVHGPSDGEVVEHLQALVGQAQQLVHVVVEVAPDAGAAQALGGALYEEVMLEDGVVQNPVFRTYRVPQFADVP